MDTVDALSQWAKKNNIAKRFVGIPKTVDNDLMVTDHCPGFASAAKFVNDVVTSTWLDYNVYTRSEVFILETMGRDAGWLAGSSVISGKWICLYCLKKILIRKYSLQKLKNAWKQRVNVISLSARVPILLMALIWLPAKRLMTVSDTLY